MTHPDKLELLISAFVVSGWDTSCPPLLGYPWLEDKIQLISGSHRWAAACIVSIRIPVVVKSYEYIYEIWGTDEWMNLLEQVSQMTTKQKN